MPGNTAKNRRLETETREQRDARLRAIVQANGGIPPLVAAADFLRVDERVLDETLFRLLTDRHPNASIAATSPEVIERRADALYPYLGRRLICILIALPGVRYTIEVDARDECVAHWECHTV